MQDMSRCRKVCRYLRYAFIGLMSVTVLLLGGGAFYLWGWTLKSDPVFHDSWTQEEREAITKFDRYLRYQHADDMFRVLQSVRDSFSEAGWKMPIPGLSDQLMIAYAVRCYAAPVSDMLHEAAESGQAASRRSVSNQDVQGLTPAIIAAQTAHLKALEALVKHGADPNAIAFWTVADAEPREAETPLSPLLNGLFINGRKLSWETRRATAEVLLDHGADINVSRSIHGDSCDIPLLSRAPEGDAPWQWALNHGMNMKPSNFAAFICHPSARALVERVLREKLVDINAVDGGETVLQKMLEMLRHNYFGDLTVEEWEARFDMLLAAGADPNLVGGKGDLQTKSIKRESGLLIMGSVENMLPVDIVREAMERVSSPDRRILYHRVMEKLRAVGARSAATE